MVGQVMICGSGVPVVESTMDAPIRGSRDYNATVMVRDPAGRMITCFPARVARHGITLIVLSAGSGPTKFKPKTKRFHYAWWDWAMTLLSLLGDGAYIEFTVDSDVGWRDIRCA